MNGVLTDLHGIKLNGAGFGNKVDIDLFGTGLMGKGIMNEPGTGRTDHPSDLDIEFLICCAGVTGVCV